MGYVIQQHKNLYHLIKYVDRICTLAIISEDNNVIVQDAVLSFCELVLYSLSLSLCVCVCVCIYIYISISILPWRAVCFAFTFKKK